MTIADGTLTWPCLPQSIKLGDLIIEGPLDLDPDVLYQESTAFGKFDPKVEFGRIIKLQRMKAGLSQEELAQASGKDKHYISRVESGIKDITVSSLSAIVNGLGVNFDVFNPLGGTGFQPKNRENQTKALKGTGKKRGDGNWAGHEGKVLARATASGRFQEKTKKGASKSLTSNSKNL